ncbi:MAG TPA: thioesterase family protein [Steroidobacteraceae bacterium]|nr:thioesterase family protein [Steroidobacteraceae bacterium]
MPHFRYYLRVRYSECDAQKVVFNARYGEYVDLAAGEFFRAAGLGAELFSGEFDYQLVKQTTEWRAPARFDQVVEVQVHTKHIGHTSFTLLAEFRIAGQEAVIATVETVYVNVDPRALTKLALPEPVRAALTRGAPDAHIDHAGHLRS